MITKSYATLFLEFFAWSHRNASSHVKNIPKVGSKSVVQKFIPTEIEVFKVIFFHEKLQ